MLRSGKGRNVVGREMMQTRIAYFFFFVHVEINKFSNEVGTKFIIIRDTYRNIDVCKFYLRSMDKRLFHDEKNYLKRYGKISRS